MVQNVWLDRQQRMARLALVAAMCSFVLGTLLPIDLRFGRQAQLSTVSSSKTSKPSNVTAYGPNLSDTPASFPPQETTAQANPSPTAAQSEVSVLSLTAISDVGDIITQQVNGVRSKISQLEQKRFTVAIPEQFKSKTVKEVYLAPEDKAIALTFDDGPWPKTTQQILDILKESNIKATFFWVGQALKNHPEIGKQVAMDGHVIANHTWNHRYGGMSHSEVVDEIESTDELMVELTGMKTPIFRPPGGVENNGLVDYVTSKGYVNVMWSSDSRDWYASSDQIRRYVLNTARSGRIVLMHDGGGNRTPTVQALPGIIDELKQQGYKFVTIPELLEMADQESKKTSGE